MTSTLPPTTRAVRAAVGRFAIEGTLDGVEELTRGHIHSTFVSTWTVPGAERARRYLHQCMNDAVFEDIPALMHNVGVVTQHMSGTRSEGDLEALSLVRGRDGREYVISDDVPWRTYEFIEGAVSYEHPKDSDMAFHAASAFAEFQVRLGSLDPADLKVTIPNFFDSEARMAQLDDAVLRDPIGRVKDVIDELAFIEERRVQMSVMESALRAGVMPRRVVHGDTKLNNVLFDEATDLPRCIVDLDTCMSGYSLYDFGDLVRFTASTADEDERSLGDVSVDLGVFEALRDGYLEHAHAFLMPFERQHMAFAARVITLTLGTRFLADHIRGDRYFKIAREDQNLDRARVQLRLVAEMERLFS